MCVSVCVNLVHAQDIPGDIAGVSGTCTGLRRVYICVGVGMCGSQGGCVKACVCVSESGIVYKWVWQCGALPACDYVRTYVRT